MGTGRRLRQVLLASLASAGLAVIGAPALVAHEPAMQEGDDVTVVVRLDAQPEGSGARADARHDAVREEIADALGISAGDDAIADGEDFYSAIDGFTVSVPERTLDEIRELDMVADAFVEREWEIEASELGQAEQDDLEGGLAESDTERAGPGSGNNGTGEDSTRVDGTANDSFDAGELELNAAATSGAGQLIAFLDSGMLTSHEAFSGSVSASGLALTRTQSEAASQAIAAKGRTASGRWISAKIPFVLDYAGGDNEVGPQAGAAFSSHGTWVAALAAGNGGKVRGPAPDAQIAMLKIGEANANGNVTLKDSAYLAALDDAVLLAPDVLNLSLGTPAGDMEAGNGADDTYAAAFANLEAADITVVAAAGNSYDAPRTHFGFSAYPGVDQPDTGIVSSPATYRHALSVAASAADATIPDFSSWGPAGDLRLKPEIAAPGAGITSADAAGVASYQEGLDGTSLATPVVAGAAATLRNHLAASAEFAHLTAAQRENAVIQLLMGTADPLLDPATGTHYSPRRQGAGRLDLASARSANVVPEVLDAPDPAFPKAELGDGTGPWTFRIRLSNYGSQVATYKISATALSEQVAGSSFVRASANWLNKGISVSASASTLTVPARSAVTVTITLRPESAFANWAASNTPNGTFVDGYILLASADTSAGAQNLTIPYLAYYGDWAAASVFDSDIWSGSANKAGIGLYSRERTGNIPLGANPFDTTVTASSATWNGKIKADRAVIGRMAGDAWNSAGSRGIPDWIVSRTALMRAASRLDYVLIGPDGQEKRRWSKTDVRRSGAAGATHNSVAEADADTFSDPLFAARAGDANLPDGRYTLRLTATVAGTARTQSRDLPFTLDSQAPVIALAATGAGEVRLRICDATYLAATQVGVRGADGTIDYFTEKTLHSEAEPDGGAWEVSLRTADLEKAWAAAGRAGNLPAVVTVTAWDYAANAASLDIGLAAAGQCTAGAGPARFVDVPASHPFAADISWLSARGITTGWADGTFRPAQPVTRAAFAAFLYRMAGCPAYAPPATSPFRDVPTSHQFYREISWAAQKGITKGWADGTFRPEASITRDAIAALLYRAAGSPNYTESKAFTDTGGSEHRAAIGWMASAGISTGWPDGTFRPGASTERGAVAAFLHRFDSKGYRVR